jgi:tRNA(fMet)-specific endonuclease VapC
MLDTDICIYIVKKKPASVLARLMEKSGEDLYISAITLSELEYAVENSGYREQNRIALLEFLSIFKIKNFGGNAAEEYGLVKKALRDKNALIGPFDTLIAAHAKSLGMILVTNNLKEFTRVEGLTVESWV